MHKLNENQLAVWRGKTIGVVFQFFQLLPTLTVAENVMLPMDFCNVYTTAERPERALHLLEQVEMADQADKLPSALSGGQQQRVAIARALANDPPILAADEPTGNLDSKTADSVFSLFERLVDDGKTIIMVTHDSDIAARVRRSLHVSDGEIVEERLNTLNAAHGRGPGLAAVPLPPRWHKVIRDLTSHKLRTLLVVLSIAVGIFAIGVVMGGRGVLTREFDTDYLSSAAPSAEFFTTDFDASLVRSVEGRSDVRAAEGRRQLLARYSSESPPATSTAGWSTMQIWALPSFGSIEVQKITREEASSWPPGPGEIVLEKSVQQVERFSIGETITVETDTGSRAELRVVGFAHDINAVPAMFSDMVVGYVSMGTLSTLKEPDKLNYLALQLDRALSQAAASRIAVDVREKELGGAGVQALQTSVPEPGSHFLGDIFKAVSLLLLALGVLSLALSGFLVITTISALMAQQIRQIGIMKAVGARWGQVMRMYLATVVLYGVLAVLVGVPDRALGGTLVHQLRRRPAQLPHHRLESAGLRHRARGRRRAARPAFSPPSCRFARGARTSVVAALNATGISPNFGHGLIDRGLGLIRGLPRPVALSLRNTFLRKGRLALTLTTLILASAVVMGVLSVRASTLKTVDDIGAFWIYDAQVFFGQPEPGADLEREAKKVLGVTEVETRLNASASLKRADGSENQGILAIGLPPDSRFVNPTISAGRWLEPDDKNGIVINADVRQRTSPTCASATPCGSRSAARRTTGRSSASRPGNMRGPIIFFDRERVGLGDRSSRRCHARAGQDGRPHRSGAAARGERPREAPRQGGLRGVGGRDPGRLEERDREPAGDPGDVPRHHGGHPVDRRRDRPDGHDDHQRARVHARDRRHALDRRLTPVDLRHLHHRRRGGRAHGLEHRRPAVVALVGLAGRRAGRGDVAPAGVPVLVARRLPVAGLRGRHRSGLEPTARVERLAGQRARRDRLRVGVLAASASPGFIRGRFSLQVLYVARGKSWQAMCWYGA